MIVKDIELVEQDGMISLQARCKIRKIGWDTIYFKVDAKQRSAVYLDASPFAAALLMPAMRQGEDLIIEGSISKSLYDGMQDVMKIVSSWGVGLQPIRIKADAVVTDTQRPHGTACFFSGGVDSFYTYLKHKNDRAKNHRIDSFILVNNSFDVDPRNRELWDLTLKNIAAVAKVEHVDLLVVTSNINSLELLHPIVSWDYIHGSCLAAVGLFLRNRFGRIYISSTHSATQQIPWGSNLALDNHWSTEKLGFVHDGTEVTRLDKVVTQVAKSPIALKHLRVCYMNTKGAYNCGKCDKCLRTMVNLYIAGALDKSKTFPHKLDLKLIATTPTIMGQDRQIFHSENLAALRTKNLNPELQQALVSSIKLAQTLKPSKAGKLRDKVAYFDHQYSKSYLYSAYTGLFRKTF